MSTTNFPWISTPNGLVPNRAKLYGPNSSCSTRYETPVVVQRPAPSYPQYIPTPQFYTAPYTNKSTSITAPVVSDVDTITTICTMNIAPIKGSVYKAEITGEYTSHSSSSEFNINIGTNTDPSIIGTMSIILPATFSAAFVLNVTITFRDSNIVVSSAMFRGESVVELLSAPQTTIIDNSHITISYQSADNIITAEQAIMYKV